MAASKLPGSSFGIGCLPGKRLAPDPFVTCNLVVPDIAYFIWSVRGADFVLEPPQLVHPAGLLARVISHVRLASRGARGDGDYDCYADHVSPKSRVNLALFRRVINSNFYLRQE